MTDISNVTNDQIQTDPLYPSTIGCERIPHYQASSLQYLDDNFEVDQALRVGSSSSSTQLTNYSTKNKLSKNTIDNNFIPQNQRNRGASVKRQNTKHDLDTKTKPAMTSPTPLPLFRITNSFSKKPPLQAPSVNIKGIVQTSKPSLVNALNLSNSAKAEDQLLAKPQVTLAQRSPASNKQARCLTPIFLNRNTSISSKQETPTANNQSFLEKSSKRHSAQNLVLVNTSSKNTIDSNNLLKPSIKSNNIIRPQEEKGKHVQSPESLLSALKKMNSGSTSEGLSPQHQSRRQAFIKKNTILYHNSHALRRKQTTPSVQSERYNSSPAQNEQCYQLVSSLNSTLLRGLFVKQKQSFNSNIIAINIEALYFPQVSSFWEKDLVSLFSVNQSEHSNTIASGPKEQIIAKLRTDIRSFLKGLTKHYTVILIFKHHQKSKDLFHYLLRMNFPFDGAYQLVESSVDTFSIDFNPLQSDFFSRPNHFISTFTYLDGRSIPFPTSERLTVSNSQNLLTQQNKVPKLKLKDQSLISLVIIERKFLASNGALVPNSVTNDQIMQAVESASERRELFGFELEVMKVKSREISLEESFQVVNSFEREEQQSNEFFEKISQIKQSNYNMRRIKLEADPDSRLEQSRNDLIDYMRSTRSSFNHLHYTVGDLLVRNREIFRTYYKDKFFTKPIHASNIAAILAEQKSQSIQKTKPLESPHSNQLTSALACIFAVIYSESRSSKENIGLNPSFRSKPSIPLD